MSLLKVALIQMEVQEDVKFNLETARRMVGEAADKGAEIICLPEMFCCPYESSAFVKNREPQGGQIWQALCRMAADNQIWLIGGSMPEMYENRIYNTCFVFSPDGVQRAKHRKIHLFDINVKGGQYFCESDTFTAGDQVTVFDTPYGKAGVEICFDIRFEELTRLMAIQGAQMVFVPAAFNMTTGPAHWEVHFRSRALDNQIYMLGCAPARNKNSSYISFGNSIVTSPWGDIVQCMDEKSGILIQEIDLDKVDIVRDQLPIMKNRRLDLYNLDLVNHFGQ